MRKEQFCRYNLEETSDFKLDVAVMGYLKIGAKIVVNVECAYLVHDPFLVDRVCDSFNLVIWIQQ